MIKRDLEAANIPVLNEYGLKLDFHSLRHTCGTRMAKNGVPLAVAQKIMRHSSPILTANFYTHILIADKSRELAKLPTIAPATSERESSTRTGTDDLPTDGDGKTVVMPVDSFGKDSMAKIKTYRNNRKGGNALACAMAENKKHPVAQGILAEREGFEPSVRVTPHDGLASRCIQPLCHLSGWRELYLRQI